MSNPIDLWHKLKGSTLLIGMAGVAYGVGSLAIIQLLKLWGAWDEKKEER